MEIAQQVVVTGASRFGAGVDALEPLGGMDGVVYAYVRNGQGYILKFVPTPLDKVEQVRERWGYARYLAEHGVRVARPVPSLAGHLLELVPDGERQWAVTCSLRAPGSHPDWSGTPERNDAVIEVWGQTLGRIHALARGYTGGAHIGGALEECDEFTAWCARERHDDALLARWHALRAWMGTLPQERDGYGLVHNDLHPQNLLVSDEGDRPAITVIDFDVCLHNWFARDIAVAVMPATWDWIPLRPGMDRNAFVRHFWHRFAEGYAGENALDPVWLARIPAFLRAHQMLLYVVFHSEWQPRNAWQENLLRGWRQAIVDDVPVTDVDFGR